VRNPLPRRHAVVAVLTAAVLLAAAVALTWPPPGDGDGGRPKRPSRTPRVVLPDAGAAFDYQIGAPYPPAPDVRVLSRDRSAEPAAGRYTICYVNAFQAQPDELTWWKHTHPRLLLRGDDGAPVVDRSWNEVLLDVSTPAVRAELASVVDSWVDGCARRGFQAVEPDNLDSYERSEGRLTPSGNAAFARTLVRHAHAAGLAVAQKNTAGLLPERQSIGFDFAVTEECGRYGECGRYAAAYAGRVFDVEYETRGLTAACRGAAVSVVLRDRDVRPPGTRGHLHRTCTGKADPDQTPAFTGSRATTSNPPPDTGSALTTPP
jgi:Glycoside-hydrolase family GH114